MSFGSGFGALGDNGPWGKLLKREIFGGGIGPLTEEVGL